MVISLTKQNPEWVQEFTSPNRVTFASASARTFETTGTPPILQVYYIPAGGTEHLIDSVTLFVPHSWWTGAAQPFAPNFGAGDKLKLVGLRISTILDVRVDFEN